MEGNNKDQNRNIIKIRTEINELVSSKIIVTMKPKLGSLKRPTKLTNFQLDQRRQKREDSRLLK